MTAERIDRRRLLTATAAGVATALAGCGYRPGGGEFEWQIEFVGYPGFGGSTDETWRTDGHSLFRVRNRSGQTFQHDDPGSGFVEVSDARVTACHPSGETGWSRSAARQYVGDPAVDDGRVYLSLVDGGVTALEGPDDERAAAPSDSGGGESDPEPRWTTDWEGPPLSLHAANGAVVGVHEAGLVGFDADDGTERFALEGEPFDADAIVDIALATDRLWVLSDLGDEPGTTDHALYGLADGGTVETTRSLPAESFWVEPIGSDALVGVDDAVRAITADGDRRFTVGLEKASARGTPMVVADAERCYHYSLAALEAIDVSAGEVVWRREDDSFSGTPVADEDGVYGRGSTAERGACELVAVARDGDQWWTAPTLEELGCSGDYFLVDDRIVVVTREDIYGFRKAPSEGLTIL